MSYGSPSRCCVGEHETENHPHGLSHLPSAWLAFLLPPSFPHGAPPEAGWVLLLLSSGLRAYERRTGRQMSSMKRNPSAMRSQQAEGRYLPDNRFQGNSPYTPSQRKHRDGTDA